MPPYQIVSYSDDGLLSLLINSSSSSIGIGAKDHFLLLKDYFGSSGLHAKTIVVEEKYISRDFFSDYSSYYSICFKDYSKFCKRLHFFDKHFDNTYFKKIITNKKENNSEFDKSYLGFIVIKPLPYTVIGTTLLKNYSHPVNSNHRVFFGTRDYVIHLFGYNLKLNSLAFQEQDSVLSACATTAIWVTLQKAAELDYHITIKTPYEITKDAGLMSLDGGRLFPNKKGLSIYQMCQTLTNSGLVVELRQNGSKEEVSNSYLKKLIYSYSPIGIPIILIIKVPIGDNYGYHAIAINGYKYSLPESLPPSVEISFKADEIEKIYAHDDQWGPFARVEFNTDNNSIITNWTRFHFEQKPTYTIGVLIPVFPKIRLSYDDIEAVVVGIDEILTLVINPLVNFDFKWDIRVDYSETYKSKIRDSDLSDELKEKLLFKSLPKYIWIATCLTGDFALIDFIFDATDIANSMFMIDVICYHFDFKKILKENLEINPDFVQMFKHPNGELFYKEIIALL